MKSIYLLVFIALTQISFAQTNYFDNGNQLLQEKKFEEAQKMFEAGLQQEPDNIHYKNQIALSLIKQGKNKEAENILEQILETDSLNVATLWYSGLNNFTDKDGNFRKAIYYFEKAYPLIDKNSVQYFAVNFFIGKSYQNLLYSEGITYDETSRILETFKLYTELQPNAEDYQLTADFINYIEDIRPPSNVEKWNIANSEEKAMEILKQELKEN